MSNKSTVPPYTKTDGTKVRGHEKAKPKSAKRRGADPDAAAAAAAAANDSGTVSAAEQEAREAEEARLEQQFIAAADTVAFGEQWEEKIGSGPAAGKTYSELLGAQLEHLSEAGYASYDWAIMLAQPEGPIFPLKDSHSDGLWHKWINAQWDIHGVAEFEREHGEEALTEFSNNLRQCHRPDVNFVAAVLERRIEIEY